MVIGKFKKTLSISLVVMLLLPMTIKLFDGLFHHHLFYHSSEKNAEFFHQYHKKCIVLSFELFTYLEEHYSQVTQKPTYVVVYLDNYHFKYYCNQFSYTFLLRAPPETQKDRNHLNGCS